MLRVIELKKNSIKRQRHGIQHKNIIDMKINLTKQQDLVNSDEILTQLN